MNITVTEKARAYFLRVDAEFREDRLSDDVCLHYHLFRVCDEDNRVRYQVIPQEGAREVVNAIKLSPAVFLIIDPETAVFLEGGTIDTTTVEGYEFLAITSPNDPIESSSGPETVQ